MYTTVYQTIHLLDDWWLFPYFGLSGASVNGIDIWQAYWLELVGNNLCADIYQSIPKVSSVMGIFAVTFCSRHCLGQGTVAFGYFFVWTLSILLCIRKLLLKYPTWLKTYGNFHIFTICFASALPWSNKSGIWQTFFLARSCRYLSECQINQIYQNIPDCFSSMAISLTDHGRTSVQMDSHIWYEWL